MPVYGEMDADEVKLYVDESGSLENLRHIRRMALLRHMIDSETGEKVAKALKVSYKTVSRAVESVQLTARMSAELERHLLLGGDSTAAQQRESVRELEERLGRNIEELRGAIEKATTEVRKEQALGSGGWNGGCRRWKADGAFRTPRKTGRRLRRLRGDHSTTW